MVEAAVVVDEAAIVVDDVVDVSAFAKPRRSFKPASASGKNSLDSRPSSCLQRSALTEVNISKYLRIPPQKKAWFSDKL